MRFLKELDSHTHTRLGSSTAAIIIMIDTADLQLFLSTIDGGSRAVNLLEIGLSSKYGVNGLLLLCLQ